MKVIEHLQNAKEPTLSCEIVPPPRGRTAQDIIDMIATLNQVPLSWIDVTNHSSMASVREKTDGTIERRIAKKRPGTVGICGIIQNRFKIDTVAHILCRGFPVQQIEDDLVELHFLGIHNIFAIRGDSPNFRQEFSTTNPLHEYAVDLVKQISNLRKGLFLDPLAQGQPIDFGIGVAGYPEKHFESPNLSSDLQHLKIKVDSGADYITTQMFFGNNSYFDFVRMCRAVGIQCPIVPGLKIIKSLTQLNSLPKAFHIDIPEEFSEELQKNPSHVEQIGLRWALNQAKDLLEKGAPGVHFYVMNDATLISSILKTLRS